MAVRETLQAGARGDTGARSEGSATDACHPALLLAQGLLRLDANSDIRTCSALWADVGLRTKSAGSD